MTGKGPRPRIHGQKIFFFDYAKRLKCTYHGTYPNGLRIWEQILGSFSTEFDTLFVGFLSVQRFETGMRESHFMAKDCRSGLRESFRARGTCPRAWIVLD